MAKAKLKKKKQAKKAAQKKVPELFARASKHVNQKVASRLVRKGRRLAMKFRMNLRPYKHLFCKHCYTRFTPSNSRVRIHGGKIIYHCVSCKKFRRIPIGKKVKG